MLTLHSVASDPSRVTWAYTSPTGASGRLRPLEPADQTALCGFMERLGPETRTFFDVDDPTVHAAEMCEAIDRYDKLRFVVEERGGSVEGLLELSFGLPEDDRTRFAGYGVELRPGIDVRFGACLADALQGKGLATQLWPRVTQVARRFACSRILLWGGVLASNARARRFYGRVGFEEAGRFTRRNGDVCVDMIVDLARASLGN